MTLRPRPAAGRRRAALLGVGALVIISGLLVHVTGSGPVADFTADALYAVLISLIVAVILPRASPLAVAGLALAVCVAIELFQLTGVPSTLAEVFPPARLVFGTTFTPVDIVAYAVGVILTGLLDAAAKATLRARVV